MIKIIENVLSGTVVISYLRNGELVRYAIAGIINTAVGFIVYWTAIKYFNAPFWLANLFAIFAGIICGFTLARLFVFKNQIAGIRSNIWKYIVTILLQYAIGTALIGTLIHVGFNEIISYILVLPAAISLSFVLQKYWVFESISKVQFDEL